MKKCTTKRCAATLWLAAAATYLLCESAAAFIFSPPYSYAYNYISDLGVIACGAVFEARRICSPLHASVNIAFVLEGSLFLGAALVLARSLQPPSRYVLLTFAALFGIGISFVGIFPEVVATKATSSMRFHAFGALLAVVFGNATSLSSIAAFRELGLSRLHRLVSIVLPVLAAIALAMLAVAHGRSTVIVVPDGVWERLSVYAITAWELLTAICLLLSPSRSGA